MNSAPSWAGILIGGLSLMIALSSAIAGLPEESIPRLTLLAIIVFCVGLTIAAIAIFISKR